MTTELAGYDERTDRVERLNAASLRRVIEPEVDVVGEFRREPIIPEELFSVRGLGLALTPDQRNKLAREEVAAVNMAGLVFEAALMSGFMFEAAVKANFADPRFTYMLHEVAEETRHSRLFVRMQSQLKPTARNPFTNPIGQWWRSAMLPFLMRRPASLTVVVLIGEEIPDLFQKVVGEHPDSDEYLRAVCHYHRLEEARHLAFARTVLGEHYQKASPTDRFVVRWIVPLFLASMFDIMVHPFVYTSVGLPITTWFKVRANPERIAIRHEVAQSVLGALLDSGAFRPGRIPPAWRHACGVDANGTPTPMG